MTENSKSPTVETYALNGRHARNYNDFMQSMSDVQFCQRLLSEHKDLLLDQSPGSNLPNPQDDLRRAIWTSIIVRYFTCFKSSASRRSLNPDKVFSGNKGAKDNFHHMKHVRDKNIVHDENGSSMSNVVVQIVDGIPEHEFKCFTVGAGIVSTHIAAMENLLQMTTHYIQQQLAVLSNLVQEQFRKMSIDDVRRLKEFEINIDAAMYEPWKIRNRLD